MSLNSYAAYILYFLINWLEVRFPFNLFQSCDVLINQLLFIIIHTSFNQCHNNRYV